jgi:hypothetical protein
MERQRDPGYANRGQFDVGTAVFAATILIVVDFSIAVRNLPLSSVVVRPMRKQMRPLC